MLTRERNKPVHETDHKPGKIFRVRQPREGAEATSVTDALRGRHGHLQDQLAECPSSFVPSPSLILVVFYVFFIAKRPPC